MTNEQATKLIEEIAQAACDSFDLKEHLRSLYWDTLEDLETNIGNEAYIKQQAEFFGLEIND